MRLGQRYGSLRDSDSSEGELEIEDSKEEPYISEQGQSRERSKKLPLHGQKQGLNPSERQRHASGQIHPSLEPGGDGKRGSLSPTADSSSVSIPIRTESNVPGEFSSASRYTLQRTISWSHLPANFQRCLEYHRNHVNYHAYFFEHRSDHFLHVILPERALTYEPLLFAVVGFAAFQMALKQPGGQMEDFLDYYNQSVKGLRTSLADGEAYSETMILTILQLATFEVGYTRHPCSAKLTSRRNILETGSISSVTKGRLTECFWICTQQKP